MPTTPDAPTTDGLVDGLLAAVAEQLGQPLPGRLQEAFHRVPRHRFLPDRIWLRDGSGGYRPVDRATEPDGWWAAAYSDEPLVTRFTTGLPSSSASMPSMVARMLLLAGLAEHPAQGRVLELGAGTGFNAGLLCALVGDEQVTTIDLDPTLAADAQETLKTAGCAPTVVDADGALGWPPNAPYDVVLATFSVDHIPPAWLTQLRPGGRIVTPWTSASGQSSAAPPRPTRPSPTRTTSYAGSDRASARSNTPATSSTDASPQPDSHRRHHDYKLLTLLVG